MGTFSLIIAGLLFCAQGAPLKSEVQPLRVLIVTGGHEFERPQFFAMFDAMKGITWKEAVQPEANQRYAPDAAKDYDVLVLYDMYQDISAEQKAQLIKLVKDDGKGLVALHHSLASYQKWPEFHAMIGGQYYLADTEIDGVKHAQNTFDHGQSFRIRIADPKDPVTKGMSDFDIVDETYGGFEVRKNVKPLLMVDHPKSGPIVGWSHTYGRGRVVYLQSGHDHTAYENENYRTLVRNAIFWVGESTGK